MATKQTQVAALTLHQGAAAQTFVEHPTEAARRALLVAADIETPHVAAALRRVAASLPERPGLMPAPVDDDRR